MSDELGLFNPEPEIFDPENETCRSLAPMNVVRSHLANAILLTDGRVMTAGSSPGRGLNELRIETYCPPYLYMGDRPAISKSPLQVSYGESFEIETPGASNVGKIVLLRPSIATHCVNTEQRYVGL